MLKKGFFRRLFMAPLLMLSACTGIPEGIEPVGSFDLSRYLGTWYEIARLDHPFERGLSNVSATYRMLEDGGVRVLNRGYSAEDGEWQEAEGTAYFVDSPDIGYLKVSFFGPFYGSYIIFELDRQEYRYALVCGPDRSYLWLLARDTSLPEALRQELVQVARSKGFAVDELIWVAHDL